MQRSDTSQSVIHKGIFWSIIGFPGTRKGKWIVLVFWIVVIAAASPFASKLNSVQKNDSASFLPDSAESLKVDQLQAQFSSSDTIAAVVIYHRDGGLTSDDQAIIDTDRAEIAGALPDAPISPTTLSQDGQAATYAVQLNNDDKIIDDEVSSLRSIVDNPGDGLVVKITGPAGFYDDLTSVFKGIDTTLLLATASVVAVLLLITYRSPILWILPLLSVAIADQAAMAVVYGLVKQVGITVDGQSGGILPVLVFGVGTDYALLLLARYREELHRHGDHHQAMVVALQRAAPAILASAATVIIGLLCLLSADLRSNKSLGPVGAAGILMALLAMLTFLPALLAILGRRVFWPFVPKAGTDAAEESRFWSGIGKRISVRPRPVWIVTVVLLGLMALGLTQIDTNLSQADSFRNSPESIEGQQLLSQSFAAGASAPTIVVANSSAADAVEQALSSTTGVVNVQAAGQSGDLTQFLATISAEPNSAEAFKTVDEIRNNVHAVPGANALVGGQDAQGRDVQQANTRDREIVIPAVLAVVFIILCLLLRAVFAPLVLIATVILSFAASLGVSILVFEHIFGFAGIDPSLPLLGFVFLVALGIDYNIFLMSRVHEEAQRIGTRAGMLRGLAVTGAVITAAGIVLAATFSVLGVLPLVVLTELGFLVAFGVLLDTLIVRSVLVPALTFDIGQRIWWPSALARRVFPVRPVDAAEQVDQTIQA